MIRIDDLYIMIELYIPCCHDPGALSGHTQDRFSTVVHTHRQVFQVEQDLNNILLDTWD